MGKEWLNEEVTANVFQGEGVKEWVKEWLNEEVIANVFLVEGVKEWVRSG